MFFSRPVLCRLPVSQKGIPFAGFAEDTSRISVLLCRKADTPEACLPTVAFSNNKNSSESGENRGIACGLIDVNCDILGEQYEIESHLRQWFWRPIH